MSNTSVPNVYPPVEGLEWVDVSWPMEDPREAYQIKLYVKDNANGVLREETLPQVYESVLDANYWAQSIKRAYPPDQPGGKPREIGLDLLEKGSNDATFTCNGEELNLWLLTKDQPGMVRWGVDKQLYLDAIIGKRTLFCVKVERAYVFQRERNVFYMNDSELPLGRVATPEDSEQSGREQF